MTATTFMHTGDVHMDSDAHGTINPKTGLNTAWESNYRVLRHIAEVAVERKVDFFLDAGDLTKSGRPSQEALMLIVDALTPLAEAHIPIILIDGNHHMTGVPSDHRTLIHAVAGLLRALGGVVFIASDPTLITLPGGQQVATLPWLSKNRVLNSLGLNDLSPAEGDDRVAKFAVDTLHRLVDEADLSSPLIMASHVTVDDLRIDGLANGFVRGSEMEIAHLFSEPILPRRAVEELPFSYAALSHIHTPQQIGDVCFYAGSPNRLTFTDMPDVKGANLVTIGEQGLISMERILTPARLMAEVDLESIGFSDVLQSLQPTTLVRVLLETGNPAVPREISKAITDAGAILAETKPRPKPRETPVHIELPEKVDPIEALRTWGEHNKPGDLDIEELISAAQKLQEN